ncbi:hypothetical protein ACFPME_12975 [Rhodanobacter umsongensis]|uniref:Uncharacterized protein n=1 Tax=Rhodanobacter umsongensis TaxID=633153 RepID=A0ABW0JNG2_9GAMM
MARTDMPKGNSKKASTPAAGRSIPPTTKPAAGGRAARAPLKADDAIRQAVQPEGGVGGRSGTGQRQPHHAVDEASGKQATQSRASGETELPEPSAGPGYQSGGRGLDREQRVVERKQRESGVGKTMDQGPGLDPPPGAPLHHRR